ncbi:MAG: tetratricopeptide repeat protein [Planctomycetota bacterium]|nr:tetratricopeptide repeat protein [Planctomycetota bacterium]
MSPWLVLATCCLAQEFTPADAQTLLDAQSAINEERFADAVESLLPLQAKYPTEGEIPRLLTHAYFGQNKLAEARRMAIQSIGLGRVTQDVLVRVAEIDHARDDQVALLNTVRLLTIVDADQRDWRVLYADLLVRSNSLDEAVTVLRHLTTSEPESAELQLRLGNVLLQQQKFDEAATTLTTAFHLGAKNEKLPLTLAGVWQQLKDDREALVWIERAIALSTTPRPDLQLQSAQLLQQLGNSDRAKQIAEPLTRIEDRKIRSRANLLLGHIANAAAQTPTAVAHWQQAVDDGTDSAELQARLGARYFNAGQHPQAAALLKQVVDGESAANEQRLRFLITSLIKAESIPVAREYLVQYIERHGLSERARELIRSLATQNDSIPASPPHE